MGPLSLTSVTHILLWWNLKKSYFTYTRSKKYMNHVTQPLNPADISIYAPEISKFAISRNTDKAAFWYMISNSFNFFWAFKGCFYKHGYNFDDISKMATLGFFEINVLWNKSYDVIISGHNIHNITNKMFTRDSIYIAGDVMWSKFGNSSISIREVIIISIL